jgi:hypothetical protein
MKFFLAFEPRDFIHPEWTPKDDLWEQEKGPRRYLWEVYDPPPLDGVLVSRSKLTGKAHEEISKAGIKEFLRYKGPVFGDCGAFIYKEDPVPPFEPSEMLSYYDKCGFDLGATIDSMILSQKKPERERRREITMTNAEAMFREWDSAYRNNWQLVGVAQGWDAQSYSESIRTLIEIGFDHIALGSLARRPTTTILELLTRASQLIKESSLNIRLHLFGVWRPSEFHKFMRLGATSFDTATVLRQAWLRFDQGYHLEHETYAAIRVREDVSDAEMTLSSIRIAAKEQDDVEEILKKVVSLDGASKKEPNELTESYKRTLRDRPWEKCSCPLCMRYGVDMVIFRGNERNMRRGFHNVWHMYESLRQQIAVASEDHSFPG